jgi:hypothetical protein
LSYNKRRGTLVGKYLSYPCQFPFSLQNVREKLDATAKERHNFHLSEGALEIEAGSFDWRQTWSWVNESEIYGRGKEKQDLVNMPLTSSDDFSIYAICGILGGWVRQHLLS